MARRLPVRVLGACSTFGSHNPLPRYIYLPSVCNRLLEFTDNLDFQSWSASKRGDAQT